MTASVIEQQPIRRATVIVMITEPDGTQVVYETCTLHIAPDGIRNLFEVGIETDEEREVCQRVTIFEPAPQQYVRLNIRALPAEEVLREGRPLMTVKMMEAQ